MLKPFPPTWRAGDYSLGQHSMHSIWGIGEQQQ